MRRWRWVALVAPIMASTLLTAGPAAASSIPGAGQWSLAAIGAPQAWARTVGQGATVAVIDTGIDAGHPDLVGAVVGSVSCVGTGGDQSRCGGSGPDGDGHGTAVAGLIAGRGVPRGMAGVAPGASLLAVNVYPPCLARVLCRLLTNSDDISAGIRWAVNHGANIVNISIGADSVLGLPIGPAVQYAWQHGVDVVAATGNDANLLGGSGFGDLPVIAVTALARSGVRAGYADNVGSAKWGLAAPGGETSGKCPDSQVLSTTLTGYACWWGTSFAAPQVAGALALLRSLRLDAQQAVDRLLATAQPIAVHEPDPVYGYGMLSVGRAVAGVRPVSASGTTPSTSLKPLDAGNTLPIRRAIAPGPAPKPAEAAAAPVATTTSASPGIPVAQSLRLQRAVSAHGRVEWWSLLAAGLLAMAAIVMVCRGRANRLTG
jgi:subtilisin family serine protease